MKPYYQDELVALYHARCEEVLPTIAEGSVNLIATDPPYFRVKDEPWDRAWKTADGFVAWLGGVADEWRRVLASNGSLYVFAGPRMSARVEVMVGERFDALNRIRWVKGAGWHKKAKAQDARRYLSPWEEVVFAQQYGADGMALGQSGYAAQCERLRGFVFEPLRAYLDGERKRAGVDKADCNAACGFSRTPGGMASRHYFSRSQWCLPTAKHYEAMRALFNANGGEYLRRDYEDLRRDYEDLRRDYEDLRREYEDLRRPFNANGLSEDVWRFPTVKPYPGKHPCEKPLAMMEHIVRTSSRSGDTVLDCFAGSGSTLEAAVRLGRKAIGVEMDEAWCEKAAQRLSSLSLPLDLAGAGA